MSLYIGNLSSRSRQDELQHVFQKFGRCNVRLKDGYGFVVYEFPPNAKKALRALQKKYICGEPLTLTWSNKQPRPFERSVRSTRSHNKPQHGMYFVKGGDYAKGKLGSNNQDYRMSVKQSDVFSRRHGSTDKLDKEATYLKYDPKNNLEEEHHGYKEDFLSEGDRFEPVPADRWGKQFHDKVNEKGVDHAVEFDRYEPLQGKDRKTNDEIRQMVHRDDSSGIQSPPKGIGTDHISEVKLKRPNDGKLQVTCYRCGGSGHKKRNCPQENTSLRKSSTSDSRHDDEINKRGEHESELEKFGSGSGERLRSGGDANPGRQLENDMKSSGLGKHQRSRRSRSSPVGRETDMSKKKQYDRNKRSWKEIGSPKGQSSKKARSSFLSPSNSDYTASPSHSASRSSEHVNRSYKKSISRSVSSRAGSLLSQSRSSPTTYFSRSKVSKSRARSSSRTSLSVSLGCPLHSSSNKAHVNLKGSSDNGTTSESIEKGQLVEGDNWLGDSNLENGMVVANNENAAPPSKMVIEIEKDQPVENDHEDHKVASGSLHEVADPSTTAGDKGTVDTGSFCTKGLVEMDCQNSDELMMEHVPIPLNNLDSGNRVSSCSDHSITLSSEELCKVLKHYYGLDLQDTNDRHLQTEAYFGSARLWPWEVIYYRRLKKGPISIENYARRVEQNREFGIVDKYIRSSSGWKELA
ncbi:hypothetical protein JCGZ_08791 [Jatropha curcas]|uniref:CCHC-type domain-containing protein n=1 Tax=Jatropha curcas TaxID=180498 RepID=A0A067KJ41_JATCU|nr:uncharacterized protein LOC105635846 [Jatropha curcas]KDP36147.1 hypothetical protein JCGZ_08791 [Jatropha curcas]